MGFETKLFSLLGIRFTVKQLKCKFNRLLEQHQLFSWMFKQTEVGWDSSTNSIDVLDDKWEQFIKRNPKIKHFVERVANTMRCLLRFSTPPPSQVNCTMPQPRSPQSLEEESELEEDFINDGVHVDANPEIETNENVSGPSPTRGQKGRSSSVSERERRSRKEFTESKMLSVLQAWTKALVAKIEVSLASADCYNQAYEATSSFCDPYSIGSCVDILVCSGIMTDNTCLLWRNSRIQTIGNCSST